MKTNQLLKVAAGLTAMLLSTACGQGFKSVGTVANNLTDKAGCTNCVGNSDWQNLKMDGAVKEGKYENRKMISLDKENKILIVRLPTLVLPIMVGNINQSIPQLPGSTIKMEVGPDGNLDLVLRLPLQHLMQGASFMDPQRLPNGDPLPAIPDGELPGLAINLNNNGSIKFHLYLAPGTIGAFVTTPFNPMVSMQLPIYQGNGAVLGYLTTVPEKNASSGGLFMSVKLPADVARIIDDVI